MATKDRGNLEEMLEDVRELLKDQMIIQLGLAGVPQQQIRQIVKTDIMRVNRIVKQLKKSGG